jgi:hypothetical protein
VVNAEGTNNELDIINELPNEQSAASERSPDDKARCAECGLKNEVMKQCARCIGIVYCSRECQVKQWHRHKLNCWPKVEKFLLSGTPVEKSSSGNTDGGESNEVCLPITMKTPRPSPIHTMQRNRVNEMKRINMFAHATLNMYHSVYISCMSANWLQITSDVFNMSASP